MKHFLPCISALYLIERNSVLYSQQRTVARLWVLNTYLHSPNHLPSVVVMVSPSPLPTGEAYDQKINSTDRWRWLSINLLSLWVFLILSLSLYFRDLCNTYKGKYYRTVQRIKNPNTHVWANSSVVSFRTVCYRCNVCLITRTQSICASYEHDMRARCVSHTHRVFATLVQNNCIK